MVQDNDRLSGRIGASLPFFAFNDTYDKDRLNQNLYWSINRLYTRALEGQSGLCQMFRYNGHMSSFKRDQKLNGDFDLPYTTYSLKIPLNVINFFTSKFAKEANNAMRMQARFWDNLDAHPIQNEIWRCTKQGTNIMSNGTDTNPMHTPDYKYDLQYKYITRDICTKDGVRYKIDKAKYPYIYSIQETYGEPNLFNRHYALFINGYFFGDVKFFVDTGHLYLFIITVNDSTGNADDNDLTLESTMKEWIANDVPYTIMGFPFSTCKGFIGDGTDLTFSNGSGIQFDAFKENFTPNMKYRNNLWLVAHSSRKGRYIMVPSLAKLESSNANGIRIKNVFDSLYHAKINTKPLVYMEAFNLRHADGYNIIGTAREFQLPLKSRGADRNPIPPQNIMLFTINENNELKFLHSAVIKLYYPNVYSISNVADDVRVVAVWFYNYDDTSEHTVFDNPLKNYMAYNANYPYKLLRGTLPKVVSQYVPATVEYDYDDYFIYRRSAKAIHGEYMIEKISEVMKDNPARYEYLYASLMERTSFKLHANPKQVVYIHELMDIKKTYVMDNRECCPMYNAATKRCRRDGQKCNGTCRFNTNYVEKFDIPHVGFRIEHSENCDYRYAVWIDGVWFHIDHLHDNAFTTYIYIPYEKLENANTVEIEMMRVTGRGRIEAEIQFGNVDSSIEIPRVFNDVSPQSLMISVRKVIDATTIEHDAEKSYVRYLREGAIYGEPDGEGNMTVYRVAPDYEMDWMVFGYIEYRNSEMVKDPYADMYKDVVVAVPDEGIAEEQRDDMVLLRPFTSEDEHIETDGMIGVFPFIMDAFHESDFIQYPFIDSDGSAKTINVIHEKHKHEAIHEQYSITPHIDWRTGSTVLTDVKVNLEQTYREKYPQKPGETEEDFETRVSEYMSKHPDSSVIMPLNTAINRDYFKTSDGMYYVTTFDFPWPNGFYALAKRRFYQYLPYGPDAERTIYMTPVGKPTKRELTEQIVEYVHDNNGHEERHWISGEKIYDNDLIYYNPGTDKWYRVLGNGVEVEGEIDLTNFAYGLSNMYIASADRYITKLDTEHYDRDIGIVPVRTTASSREISIGKYLETSGAYLVATVRSYHSTELDTDVQKIEFILYETDTQPVLSEGATIIPGSRLLITEDASEAGDIIHGTYGYEGETYTAPAAMDEFDLRELRTRVPVIGDIAWNRCPTEFREFYPNPDVYVTDYVSRSFFERRVAIIQNTDFYYSKKYILDYQASSYITTENFYDDPSHHKFRITLNGRRLDHGSDYTTDIDIEYGYMRGSPIRITFNRESTTVQHAILASYENLTHLSGRITNNVFYEQLSINPDGTREISTYATVPDIYTIYHNIDEGGEPYIWDGNNFVRWDGTNNLNASDMKAAVYFEFLPYKDRIVWKSSRLRKAEITIPRDELKRPLSFAYYDIYYDGMKLTPDRAKIVSPRCIKLLGVIPNGEYLTIYERCHDDDLYGNQDGMPDSLDDLIAARDKGFKKFLFK